MSTAPQSSIPPTPLLQSRRILYVSGLAESVKEMTLRAAFVPFGPVKSVEIPMDFTTGAHKGFGFVEFEDPEDTAEAIYNMDGGEIMGKTLTVNLAQPNNTQALLGSQQAVWTTDEWFQDQVQKENEDFSNAKSAQADQKALAER